MRGVDKPLRDRLLAAVAPPCGPATRAVLRGLAKSRREHLDFETLLKDMLAKGELVAYGNTKGATYGLPRGH